MWAIQRVFFLLILLFCIFFLYRQTRRSQQGFNSVPHVQFDLEAIKRRGYIIALVDNNSISYFIYKGQAMGYEYELLKFLAKELHVSLKVKVTSGVENAIDQLNRGQGDILAFPLTINKARKQFINFTKPHFTTYQVLVQRKPKDWQKLTLDEINSALIRNPVALIGKEVHVIGGTSFEIRLQNLSEEIGGDIIIKRDTPTMESESVIQDVAFGKINFTVTDHTMAQVNASYYPNLDVKTVISLPQQIAWAVRKNSPQLEGAVNSWIKKIKKESTFMVIYNRYFRSPRTSLIRMQSDYSSFGEENKLSHYDDLIKEAANKLDWDWLLLASLIYQESQFKPIGESWAGARGLMQLMPATAKRFGVKDPDNPRQSIKAGVNYLKYLNRFWLKKVPDSLERLKFILASYNAGLSHIVDAANLTEKYDQDPGRWEGNVEYFLLRKSETKFYRDPVVKAGYCKCEEPVNYVKSVFERYEQYKTHILH
jgi:membrane-bound lytic murein transglycosylase F